MKEIKMKKFRISFSTVVYAENEKHALDIFSSQNYPRDIFEFEDMFTVKEDTDK